MGKPKILVVEDEKDVAKVITINLKLEGMDVIEAHDGPSALRLLEEEQPDCVLLDIMLPKISGWDVLKFIKSHPTTADVPVVMVTAKVAERDQLRGLGSGAVKYITKPFSPATLVETIKSVLKPQVREAMVRERKETIERLQLATLHRISDILISTGTIEELAEGISKKITTTFEIPCFALLLLKPGNELFVYEKDPKGATGPPKSRKVTADMKLAESVSDAFDKSNNPLRVSERGKLNLRKIFPESPSVREGYVFPLLDDGVLLGALIIAGKEMSLSGDEVELFKTIANQVSMAALRARIHEELMEDEMVKRLLLYRTIRAQEAERRRLASEIHDSVLQSLVGITFKLRALEGTLPQDAGDEPVRALRKLENELSANIEELRSLLLGLIPPALEEFGFLPAVREYLNDFSDRTGIKTEMEAPEEGLELSKTASINIFRIIQEALNNVEKHASAKCARVSINIDGEVERKKVLRISISDDGKGFSGLSAGERIGNLGIATMRERANLVGGELNIDSKEGKGTTVSLQIPMERLVEG